MLQISPRIRIRDECGWARLSETGQRINELIIIDRRLVFPRRREAYL